MNTLSKKFAKDSSWAILSQGVSLMSSLVVSFILPKFIGVDSFGYWQLFMLYTSYIGILHFGFSDGVYLNLGGVDFKDINYRIYVPQIRLVILIQILFAFLVFLYSYFYLNHSPEKQIILYYLSLFIIIDNTYKVLSFIFMATGEMAFYSKTIMIDKSIFSIVILMYLFLLRNVEIIYVIGLFLICHAIVLCLSVKKFKVLFCKYSVNTVDTIKRIIKNCSVGIVLMASNIMATLIVGSCKFIVEKYWDIVTFSKLSFALTISTFLLFFISQISYVLFPFLRKASKDSQGFILTKATFGLTSGSFYAFSLLFPLYLILYYWLPKYHDSLYFLTILAPTCIYEIRTNLLYNTFFKNLNKVKELFFINLTTFIFSLILYGTSVMLRSLDIMALSILLSIILRSIIMEVRLYMYYRKPIDPILLWDLVFTTIVVLSFHYGGLSTLCFCYFVYLLLFSIYYYKNLKIVSCRLIEKIKQK